jgi:hypothetical protein
LRVSESEPSAKWGNVNARKTLNPTATQGGGTSAILYVGRLAAIFGKDLSFLVRCRFTGLEGRILTSIQGNRMMFDERRFVDSEVIVEREITVSQSQDNLVEVLHPLLSPLYERFSFFELSEKLVTEEVGRLTRGRF